MVILGKPGVGKLVLISSGCVMLGKPGVGKLVLVLVGVGVILLEPWCRKTRLRSSVCNTREAWCRTISFSSIRGGSDTIGALVQEISLRSSVWVILMKPGVGNNWWNFEDIFRSQFYSTPTMLQPLT